MPTARNARGVDIVAYDSTASKFIGVQVKSLSKRDPISIGANLDKVIGDFWIIINSIAKKPKAFVLLPSEVKERAHREEKNGKVSYWLEPNQYDLEPFREGWQKIGFGDAQQSLSVDLLTFASLHQEGD